MQPVLAGDALRQLHRRLRSSLLRSLFPGGPLPTTTSTPTAGPADDPAISPQFRPASSSLVARCTSTPSGSGPTTGSSTDYNSSSSNSSSAAYQLRLLAAALLAAGSGAAAAVAAATGSSNASHTHVSLGPALATTGLSRLQYDTMMPCYRAFQLQNQEPTTGGGSSNSSASGRGPVAPAPAPGKAPPAATSPSSPAPPSPARPPAPSRPPAPPAFLEGAAYGVYDSGGEPSSFDALLASLESYDVVLLGEYHDDPVAHHLQLRVLRHVLGGGGGGGAVRQPVRTDRTTAAGSRSGHRELGGPGVREGRAAPEVQGSAVQRAAGEGPAVSAAAAATAASAAGSGSRRAVALSLEMFDRDVQGVMDEYLAGMLTEADLMRDARPWPNYAKDYRPLVVAAKQAGARVVCANAPRRYVSLVGRSGAAALEALPPASRHHLPSLPLRPASQQYAAKIRWTMQRAREGPSSEASDSSSGGPGSTDEEVAAPLSAGPNTATTPTSSAATTVTTTTGGPVSASPPTGDHVRSPSGSVAAADRGAPPASTAPPSGSGGKGASGGGEGGSGEVGSGEGGCPYIGLTVRSNFIDAQNLWDAAMADSIAGALTALGGSSGSASGGGVHDGGNGGAGGSSDGKGGPPGPLVVHVCGKFHSEQRLGICEHLAHLVPSARVCLVTFVPSGRGVDVAPALIRQARLHTYGDWLVLTDARLPRSFESEHPV